MAKKKNASQVPEEQEMLEQHGEAADGCPGDAPSEEGMALMESAYSGWMEEGGIPEGGYDQDGEHNFPPDESSSGPYSASEDSTATDGEEYGSLLQEFGSTEADGGGDAPLTTDVEYTGEGYGGDALPLLSEEGGASGENSDPDDGGDAVEPEQPAPAPRRRERPSPRPAVSSRRERVLTIDARDEIQTEEDREAIIWHDIQNSHRTRRILTGTLDGVEKTKSGVTLAVINYKGVRVAIPVKEMLLHTGKLPTGREYIKLMEQLHRILNARLGSEIDFIVRGYDDRSVVGSRREAMLRKRQTFYLDTDELGEPMIYEGRVVQARVVAVAEKLIRVEVFGVETTIVARDLSWEWIGSARDHYHVGDRILVRVLKISGASPERLSVRVDARSVSAAGSRENLKKCVPQSRYAGRVTDVRNGVVFVRLNNGVNAIAHSCYDSRYPGKKDDVSFAVTRLDEERGVAIGIITRIIKQNL